MKNKFEANIAQFKMQSEKMLKTMQQLSADAVYTGAFEMSLDEINAEIEAVSIMLSFKKHAKKFNLDEDEQEILADFEANHAGKTQITEERRKELASLANGFYRHES